MTLQAVPAHLSPGPLSRAIGAAMVRKSRGKSKRAILRDQLAAAKVPAYNADLSIRRGRCFACKGRYSVVRVTFDYTSAARLEPFAHVECATCGHVWYRTSVPRLGEYQNVRLTLILPSHLHRWFARGRWHAEGSDGLVVPEATWSDLMDASRDWRKRNTQYEAAKARAKERKAAKEAAALAESRALMERIHARQAEREREEREAAARENA